MILKQDSGNINEENWQLHCCGKKAFSKDLVRLK
jgi:hypothetical protein